MRERDRVRGRRKERGRDGEVAREKERGEGQRDGGEQ